MPYSHQTGRNRAFVLCSPHPAWKSAVAAVTESAVEALRAKHPAGPPSPFGTTAGPRNGGIPPEDILLADFQVVQAGDSPRDLRLDPSPPRC